jgi:hypothetical protein
MAPESERANEVLEVWAVISWALQCRSNCLLFGKHSAEEMWLALLGTLAHIRDDYGLYRRDWEKAKGKQVLSQFIAERGIKPSKQQRINEERHEANEGMTKPNDPTLTCSEVVERLAEIGELYLPLHRKRAEAILHSWRERRVQELEEALRLIGRETTFYYKNDADTSAKKLAAIRQLVVLAMKEGGTNEVRDSQTRS